MRIVDGPTRIPPAAGRARLVAYWWSVWLLSSVAGSAIFGLSAGIAVFFGHLILFYVVSTQCRRVYTVNIRYTNKEMLHGANSQQASQVSHRPLRSADRADRGERTHL